MNPRAILMFGNPSTVLSAFLSRIPDDDSTCHEAVAHVNHHRDRARPADAG
jgi:hypothetical protein